MQSRRNAPKLEESLSRQATPDACLHYNRWAANCPPIGTDAGDYPRGGGMVCTFSGARDLARSQDLAKNRYRPGLATYVAGATAATGGISRRNLGQPADGQQAEINKIVTSTLRTR